MKIEEHLETVVSPGEYSRERFTELMALNEQGALSGSQVVELSAYLVQLGLFFWIEKRQQGGKTDDEVYDAAIGKHQRNRQALQEDMEEIDEPEWPAGE